MSLALFIGPGAQYSRAVMGKGGGVGGGGRGEWSSATIEVLHARNNENVLH